MSNNFYSVFKSKTKLFLKLYFYFFVCKNYNQPKITPRLVIKFLMLIALINIILSQIYIYFKI